MELLQFIVSNVNYAFLILFVILSWRYVQTTELRENKYCLREDKFHEYQEKYFQNIQKDLEFIKEELRNTGDINLDKNKEIIEKLDKILDTIESK